MRILPDSSSTIETKHYVVVLFWLLLTVLSAIYFIQRRLVAFDPEQALLQVAPKDLVSQLLSEANIELSGDGLPSGMLIHFVERDCFCNSLTEPHVLSINQGVEQQAFSVMEVEVPVGANSILTATPASLLIDDNGELLYFGPMSSGLACSSASGFIEVVMANYQKGYRSEYVNSHTRGCYCLR